MEAEFSLFKTVGAVPLGSNGDEAEFVAKANPLFAFEHVDLEPKTPEADSES